MKYRIKNGSLLLENDGFFSVCEGDILTNGDKIEAVGNDVPEKTVGYTEIDAKGYLIMPGLINSHTHVYMNFMKNSADDIPFNSWLFEKILPIEAKMNKGDFYWSTLLGCIEMIKTGTTSYLDMHICEDECAKAAADSGMRAFIGKCLRGEDLYTDAYADFKKAIEEKEKFESDFVKFVLSPHSAYSCSEKMLLQIADEAEKRNMLKHIHLSESLRELNDCLKNHGKTPVAYLNDTGFLDSKTIAAHCVKVDSSDIEILSAKRVSVVTNPCSNAKLGNGIAPISEMIGKGVNVCLGTDSAASNNTLNLFREMNLFSLIHKANNENAADISPNDVIKSVTINPAQALSMENKTGVIAKGAYADLIFIDLKSISLFPNNNIISSLCYSANGSEVDSVMAGGVFLMRNKCLTSIDEEKVYFEVNRIAQKYL